MGIDFLNNLQNENAGRAFKHTAVTTAVTAVGVDFATTATFLASNPVGWTITAGIAVGFTVGLAYKHNFLGIRDIANEMGDNLNKSISDVGKAFDSSIKFTQKVLGW